MRHRLTIVSLVALTLVFASAGLAFGYPSEGKPDHPSDCLSCHPTYTWPTFEDGVLSGPHGDYSVTGNKCALCHDAHVAGGVKLLPKATITDSCSFCHDGTGGRSVYGTIKARGLSEGASHSVDATNAVPGGDASTGGTATVAFRGSGGNLGCDDCHSPHGSNLVARFWGYRQRTTLQGGGITTARLLKQRPGGVTYDVSYYGADWCGACHKGRLSGGAVHNHPVESSATAGFFHAGRVARVLDSTSLQTTIAIGLNGLSMVMSYPRTVEQSGHAPICEQCHEDSRDVGEPGAAIAGLVYSDPIDGVGADGNPRFLNFPHETQNRRMLLELDDDLCLNCHPAAVLP